MRKFLTVLLAVILVITTFSQSAEAARRKKQARPPQDRFAEIVIEASTGYVLSERNADKPLYPASLTKMMTLYLTFDAINNGTLNRNQQLYVSKRAAAQEPSSLGLRPGDTIRVQDAILAIATKSANDVAVVLAEAIEGSESRFAQAMTLKARRLGMKNTHFVNASGLHNRNQVSTARDMATLSRALIQNHARHYHYFGTTTFSYKGNTYMNHNKLMGKYRGMDGLKTGYVYASGYNLAASAMRGGTRLIGVVFGGRTAQSRNTAMAKLLDQAFERMDDVRVASLSRSERVAAIPAAEVIADNAASFNAMGLVMEQGDTSVEEDEPAVVKKFASDFKPRSLNTKAIEVASIQPRAGNRFRGGDWAIQVGAFSTRDAGTDALKKAKKSLRTLAGGTDSIAPLMTKRGMVYRARLSGLAREEATQACRTLKGTCLVLSAD